MTPKLPNSDDGFTDLHLSIAMELDLRLAHLGRVLDLTFGQAPTRAALRALLVGDAASTSALAAFDELGWQDFLEAERGRSVDFVALTQVWRDGAEYAAQGVAPREILHGSSTLDDRRARIEALIAHAKAILECGDVLFGNRFNYVWRAVAARAAIDFGGVVSPEGIQLLSGVLPVAIRNAISKGELQLDTTGTIGAGQALKWLERRREFCPSRWTDLRDDQAILDRDNVTTANDEGMIFVPQDAEGKPFTPEYVVRAAKSGGGLSITVGLKGDERQFKDFYEALDALLQMDAPRWRRRNAAGNWGIVRARGAWVKVSKAEIDRQLAAKAAEAR